MKKNETRREDNQTANTVMLTVIGVATLLIALIGATFAYFSATVSNNSNESVNITTAAPVALVYSGSTLALTNALPGNTNTNTFTVLNPSASPSAQTYDLKFYIDSNTFATSTGDNLLITITGATDGSNNPSIGGDFASGAKDYTNGTTYNSSYTNTFVNDQRIAVGEQHTYTAVINFADTDVEDNTNQNKTFTSHINVEDAKTVN